MPKLPLWPTVAASYQSVFGHLPLLVTAAWPWLLVSGLIGMAGAALTSAMDGSMLVDLVVQIAFMVGPAGFAIAWHRFVLGADARPHALAALGNRRLLRYVGSLVVMTLPSFLIVVPLLLLVVGMTAAMPSGDAVDEAAIGAMMSVAGLMLLAMPLVLLGLLVYALLISRFFLVLPAAALDDRTMTLGRSWRATRGNTLRLVAGQIATALPVGIVALIAVGTLGAASMSGAEGEPGLVSLLLMGGIVLAAWIVAAGLLASFLSHTYRHFQGQESDARFAAMPAMA